MEQDRQKSAELTEDEITAAKRARAEYQREYRKNHPEQKAKRAAYQREYMRTHPEARERAAAYAREWRWRNKPKRESAALRYWARKAAAQTAEAGQGEGAAE